MSAHGSADPRGRTGMMPEPIPIALAARPPRSGEEASAHRPGRATIQVGVAGGRSRVQRARATSPLRLLTPANHGRAAWVYTSTFGGGLVDGDAIALDIDVAPRAAALLSTQASSKVYRSPRGTSSRLHARVGSGALFVHLPDVLTCFEGARYEQAQRIDLASDAGVVAIDWLSSGRRAAGERWAFAHCRTRLDVYVDAAHVLHDVMLLRPDEGPIAVRMGRFDVIGTIVLAGRVLRDEYGRVLDVVNGSPVGRRAGEIVAASPLGDAGCLVRLAGPSVEDVGRSIRRLLAFVPALLGDDPWARKW
jgi:urease accessory protein